MGLRYLCTCVGYGSVKSHVFGALNGGSGHERIPMVRQTATLHLTQLYTIQQSNQRGWEVGNYRTHTHTRTTYTTELQHEKHSQPTELRGQTGAVC